MKSIQTKNLFVLSSIISDDNEAAAPISNARANDIASHLGLDSSKKFITCTVDIAETIK